MTSTPDLPAGPRPSSPAAVCPNTDCSRTLDAHIGPSADTTPKPGDISVCAHCLTPSFFTLQGKMHRLTKDDIARLAPSDRADIEAALTFLRQTRRPDT